jgi:uncharacterized protein involved in outer membrane biogenesis
VQYALVQAWSVPRFSRRLSTWLLATALLVAAYAALGFWLVPHLLADRVRDTVTERYHRTARIGPVTFNPFTFELDVRSFALPDVDGSPLLSFDRLYANLGLISVFRGGLAFQAIALERPRLRLVHRVDGAINLVDFVPPPEPHPEPNAKPPRVWIDDLWIRDGQTTVIDLARPAPLTLVFESITLRVSRFSTRSEGNEYVLAVQSPRGERLKWRGDFGLAPLASHGAFSLRNIQARTLAEVAAEQVPFQVESGQLDADGSYAFAARGESLTLHANVSQLIFSALSLRAHGEQTDAVTIPRFTLSGTALDLSAQTVKVEHVTLEKMRVTALRDSDGQLNLQRLLPTRKATPSQGKPWSIALPDVVLRDADLTFEDRGPTQPAQFHIAPLTLKISGFGIPTTEPLDVDLKTGVNESGSLSVHGKLNLSVMSGRFEIDATKIPLASAQPYLDDLVKLSLTSGKADVKGALALAEDGAISFDGQAGIDELRTTDKELEDDFVKWHSLKVLGLHARSRPLSLHIDEIAATEPYARVIVSANGVTNIHDALSPQAAAAGPAETSASLPIEIDLVRVDGGSVNFADRSIKPNFETGIQNLSGTIKGLSGHTGARADVRLAGEVDRYTPVKITGRVNYFAAVTYTDLHLNFRNLELTGLSPYSGKFAGYRIERGKLNVDLVYLINKRRLDAKHKIIVNQLQLGEHVESPDATSLPVKLAIALLKDRDGVIELDLPVSGNLDDPEFQVWPIVWKVLLNLLTKAVTAPFALLGSLFGGGDEISYVEFAPGSATLSPAARARLQTLAKALDARPALNLDVPLVVKPDVDRAALGELRWRADRDRLASRRLAARANPEAIARLLATPKDYRALLEASYREAFGVQPQLLQPTAAGALPPVQAPPPATGTPTQRSSRAEVIKGASQSATQVPSPILDADAIVLLEHQLKARITIGQADVDELARARAQQVQACILDGTGIDPGRVFVITAPPLTAEQPLRMQLALH